MTRQNLSAAVVKQKFVAAWEGGDVAVAYRWSPFRSSDLEFSSEPVGKTLAELAPVTDLPFICMLDDEPVMREDWGYVPVPGDKVVFQCLVLGGDDSNPLRVILQIAILVVAAQFTAGAGLVALLGEGGAIVATPFIQAGIVFAGNALLNAVLPPPGPRNLNFNAQTESQSSIYSVSVSGNQARLGDVIPVIYGRHLTYPDFASQPYSEYDNSGEDPDGKPANDQFYYALFCIGMGQYTLEKVTLDDTDIDHFDGVEYNMLPPGTPPSLVDPAVVNSVEVSGQTLLTGEYVGPFTITGAGNEVNRIGIDIIFPRGLYLAEDDGSLSNKTCSWLVEARVVNDAGVPSGPWTLLGVEDYTDDRSVSIRKTYTYDVTPARYEVRVQRQDVRDDNIRAGHDIAWAAMRGYLEVSTSLNPNATYFELRMRANEQLNGLSQRRIAVLVQRLLPTWSSGGGWTAPVATSSIAWAAADILRNTVYGGGFSDSRIDLATLEALQVTWSARNDRFDFVFDQRNTIWEALNIVCRSGRTARFMRGGVYTFSRDESQLLPVTIFNPRNINRNSLSIDYITPTEDTPDGLEVSYFDRDTWSLKTFVLPAPGVDEPQNPAPFALQGATGLRHVEREAYYTLAANSYRRRFVRFSTELDGLIPSYGDLIGVSHDITDWGSSRGEVLMYDPGSLTLTLSEAVSFAEPGNHYIALINTQGDLVGPILCTAGDDEYEVVLDEDPGFYVQTNLDMERTKYSFGPSTNYTALARVVSLRPQSISSVEVLAVIEDERVHTADSVVPPDGPGTDPIGRVGGYAPDGLPDYASASESQRDTYAFYADEDGTVNGIDSGYAYQPD